MTVPQMRIPAPIQVDVGAASDVGLRRQTNEDAYLAQGAVYLVADGMGGYEAGEVASATALAAFARFGNERSISLQQVAAAFADARARIAALPVGGGAGAGTTLTGVAIAEVDGFAYWLVLNLGDSRTYQMKGAVLEQISVDHSVVQELVECGKLSPLEAAAHVQRNVVTRALGAGSESEPDFWFIPAEVGDRLLICSDGLTGELSNDQIGEVLSVVLAPQAAASRLVHDALAHGGRDNITAVVVDAVAIYGRQNGDDTAPADALARDFDDTVPSSQLPKVQAH